MRVESFGTIHSNGDPKGMMIKMYPLWIHGEELGIVLGQNLESLRILFRILVDWYHQLEVGHIEL